MKTAIAYLIFFCLSLGLFWLGGFDFNERGADAVFCAFISLFAGALGVCIYKIVSN